MYVDMFFAYGIYVFSMKLRVATNKLFNSISQFSFIKQIGVGSFGTVRLGLHIETNKCFAVKVVQLTANMAQAELMLLEREINMHAQLDHPHIIKLWDTLIEKDTVYMVMELADQSTLFTYQNKHPTISEAQAYKFFSQALSAVKYMHGKDMMHRDIKPQNILLDSSLNVKLCDMGWVTDNIQLKRKTFCGTYQYMAPQMVFEKQYNYTIDIWALGILLYELIHGHAPFPSNSLQQMQIKVQQGYYELGSHISKELKSLIIDLLQFDSKERPSIAAIQKHPWVTQIQQTLVSQIGKMKTELSGDLSVRAKVQRPKQSAKSKKHKRFDSIANENLFKKTTLRSGQSQSRLGEAQIRQGQVLLKPIGQEKRKAKKCKTQGEESLQKLFTQSCSKLISHKSKICKEKENNSKIFTKTTEILKTDIFSKGDTLKGDQSNLKIRRIADRLNQPVIGSSGDKKKSKILNQKELFS